MGEREGERATCPTLSKLFNPFLTGGPILYTLKTPEKQSFSRVFKGYKRWILAGNGSKLLTIFARKLHHRYLTYFLIRLCRYTKSYYSSSTRFAENPSNSMNHSSEKVISKTGWPEKILEISVKARHFKVYNKVTFDRPFENRKNVYLQVDIFFPPISLTASSPRNWKTRLLRTLLRCTKFPGTFLWPKQAMAFLIISREIVILPNFKWVRVEKE